MDLLKPLLYGHIRLGKEGFVECDFAKIDFFTVVLMTKIEVRETLIFPSKLVTICNPTIWFLFLF